MSWSDIMKSEWRDSEIQEDLVVHCLQDMNEREENGVGHTRLD